MLELLLYGGGGAVDVAGGEQVEQGAAQHGEDEGALPASLGDVAQVGWLGCGEHGEPALDSCVGEAGPKGWAG